MIPRSLSVALLLASSALAAPPLTTIQDVLYKADGTRFNGTLSISWTSFEAIDTTVIAMQSITVTVVGGNLRVQLVPTTTSSPPTTYAVKYNSDGRVQFEEKWTVPSSVQPLRVRDVRIVSLDLTAADSVPQIQESDVMGLIADLGARPLRGPGYAPGRVAYVSPSGSLESVTGAPADCVRVDGSSGPCGDGGGGGTLPSFVDGDSPAGIVDGSNTSFALSDVPSPASSLALYRNGVLQKAVQDFTANGSAIHFVAAATPQPGDTLLASYRLGGNGVTVLPSFVDGDSPAGIVDGSNTAFALSDVPSPTSSLALYRNGVLQKAVQDFTAIGDAIHFVAAAVPQPGDTLLASYRLASTNTNSTQFPSPQVLCAGTGTAANAASFTSLGTCLIPAGILAPGDRVEIRFDFEHQGTATAFSIEIHWAAATILHRDAAASDVLVTGRADAAISNNGAQLSSQSWGTALPLNVGVAKSTDAYAGGLTIDFQARLAQAGETVTLNNYTVVRLP